MFESRRRKSPRAVLSFSCILDAVFLMFETKHNAGELVLCYKIVVYT
jgi:hypothetical protein